MKKKKSRISKSDKVYRIIYNTPISGTFGDPGV